VLARDAPAMQRFYHDVFGWRIGPPANDCAMVFPDSSMEQQ
jgi:predicted enzyme related to lactoylglutathione lyase